MKTVRDLFFGIALGIMLAVAIIVIFQTIFGAPRVKGAPNSSSVECLFTSLCQERG